jgi:hypothetical protein
MASPTDGWAVGEYLPNRPQDPLNLFHYSNGVWAKYVLDGLLPQFAQG